MKGLPISMIGAMLLLLGACKEKAPVETLPEAYQNLAIMVPDSQHVFSVGDTFLLSVGENSCCRYGWGTDSGWVDAFPGSPLLTVSEVFDVPYPEGCDGCNSYTYYALNCEKPGTDTLYRYTIPMGSLGGLEYDTSVPDSIVHDYAPDRYFLMVR